MLASVLLAIAIESKTIGNFLNLPDGIDDEVTASQQFGSGAHTNVTGRVLKSDFGALCSIFDGYFERLYCASIPAGATGVDRQNRKTVAFGSAYRSFPTNAVGERTASGSLRFVDFTNLVSFCRSMPIRQMVDADDWIFDPQTNGDRRVLWASSFTDDVVAPRLPRTDLGWLDTDDYAAVMTNGLVVLRDLARDTEPAATIHLSRPGTREIIDASFLPCLFDPEHAFYSNFVCTTTAEDVLRTKFPRSNTTQGLDNRTARLVPDDYMAFGLTNREVKISSERADEIDLTPFSPWFDIDPTDFRPNSARDYTVSWRADGDPLDGSFQLRFFADNRPYSEDKIALPSISATVTNTVPRGAIRADVHELYPGEARFVVVTTEEDPPAIDADRCYWWTDPIAVAEIDYYRMGWVTNSVATNSSMMAASTRALSMLDRTVEYPLWVRVITVTNETTSAEYRRFFESEPQEIELGAVNWNNRTFSVPETDFHVRDCGATSIVSTAFSTIRFDGRQFLRVHRSTCEVQGGLALTNTVTTGESVSAGEIGFTSPLADGWTDLVVEKGYDEGSAVTFDVFAKETGDRVGGIAVALAAALPESVKVMAKGYVSHSCTSERTMPLSAELLDRRYYLRGPCFTSTFVAGRVNANLSSILCVEGAIAWKEELYEGYPGEMKPETKLNWDPDREVLKKRQMNLKDYDNGGESSFRSGVKTAYDDARARLAYVIQHADEEDMRTPSPQNIVQFGHIGDILPGIDDDEDGFISTSGGQLIVSANISQRDLAVRFEDGALVGFGIRRERGGDVWYEEIPPTFVIGGVTIGFRFDHAMKDLQWNYNLFWRESGADAVVHPVIVTDWDFTACQHERNNNR